MKSDEELMLAYRQGDGAAFEVLYSRYASKVYGYIRSRLSDPSTSNDVFQAVFLKLHRSRSQYDSSLPFAPWLFTICRTVLIDAQRRAGKMEREDLSLDFQAVERIPAEPAEGEVRAAELNLELNLATLPPLQQQVIRWRYEEELPFDEIASRLQTSSSNVRQLVSRAIRKLRRDSGGRS